MIDYLIVGQGLAGTTLAFQLYREGLSFKIIDQYKENAASRVAAGVINPITGRRIAKTWMIEALQSYADEFYPGLEALLDVELYQKRDLYKVFSSVKDQNEWGGRLSDETYRRYLVSDEIHFLETDSVNNPLGSFCINHGRQLFIARLVDQFRAFLRSGNYLVDGAFEIDQLQFDAGNAVTYNNQRYGRVVLCEGFQGYKNPFFHWLPFYPAKGEVLFVEMEDFYTDRIIQGFGLSIVPLANAHQYYVGTTMKNHDVSDGMSDEGREELSEKLAKIVACKFRIIDEMAGIRPTTKDRRPFLGIHPEHPELAIFNGFGTKGVSLAPYFSRQLLNHIESNQVLDKEVDISRYLSLR